MDDIDDVIQDSNAAQDSLIIAFGDNGDKSGVWLSAGVFVRTEVMMNPALPNTRV